MSYLAQAVLFGIAQTTMLVWLIILIIGNGWSVISAMFAAGAALVLSIMIPTADIIRREWRKRHKRLRTPPQTHKKPGARPGQVNVR